MGKGRDFELQLHRDIERNTTEAVHVAVSDYSGGAAESFSDIEVYYPPPNGQPHSLHAAFVEVKNKSGTSGKRDSQTVHGSSQGENGRDELQRLVEKTPSWGRPYLGINWSNREMVVLRADHLLDTMTDGGESEGPHSIRLTGAGNVSARKPTNDEWPSQQSGREPWRALLDAIGVDEQYIDPRRLETSVTSV